ncbi:hypothetical protein PI124_g24581 [Phytophthora idaei]|nr:hypothetical protein PI124_g24581 [Phytophthora idaei]
MAESQDLQKEYADAQGRGSVERFEVGDLVLLNAKNLPTNAVSAVFKTKLRPRFIGPFKVVAKKGLAYTFNLPKKMRTHPMFYVGLLKSYQGPAQVSAEALARGRRLAAQQQIELTLQLSNLTLEVDDPVLKSTRCLEPAHLTVHLLEIVRQAGV